MAGMRFGLAVDPWRSLKVAWKLLQQTTGIVLVGGLLLAFLEGGNGWGLILREHRPRYGVDLGRLAEEYWDGLKPLAVFLIPLCLCFGLALFALSSWLLVGFG